jgi:hypothetical protein
MGGASPDQQPSERKNHQAAGKIMSKKKLQREVECEVYEQRRKHQELLEEWGVTDEELAEWRETNEVDGREAAYEDLSDEELCQDFIGKKARESARKTGEAIGDVRDRYDAIVMELLAARYTQTDGKRYSLSTVLRGKYESDAALKRFLPKFGKWIGEYVSDCIREHCFGFTPLYRQIVPTHTWSLCGHSVNRELLTALAEEHVRDREGLMQFLLAVFRRWRKIDEPRSLWRVQLVVQQFASGVPHHRIIQHLAKIGAVSKDSAVPGTKEYASLRERIKKYRNRDQKAAVVRRLKRSPKSGDKNGQAHA